MRGPGRARGPFWRIRGAIVGTLLGLGVLSGIDAGTIIVRDEVRDVRQFRETPSASAPAPSDPSALPLFLKTLGSVASLVGAGSVARGSANDDATPDSRTDPRGSEDAMRFRVHEWVLESFDPDERMPLGEFLSGVNAMPDAIRAFVNLRLQAKAQHPPTVAGLEFRVDGRDVRCSARVDAVRGGDEDALREVIEQLLHLKYDETERLREIGGELSVHAATVREIASEWDRIQAAIS